LEPEKDSAQATAVDPLDWHLRKAEATSYLETVEQRLEGVEASVETLLLEGGAAQQIVGFARRHDVDLIVLSSHGRSGLSPWNVSSVVQKIIFRANTSVMIVRAYHQVENPLGDLQYRRIVVPLDGSRRAEHVLPLTMALAEPARCKPWLVNVVARPEMPRHGPPSPEDAALADELTGRNRKAAERYLEQLKERVPGAQIRTLIGDSVITALHDFVNEEEMDLVVFSAHGHSGSSRRPYGSVVTSFIVYGNTPLLIVQDVPQEEIEPGEAEVVASQTGKSDSGKGGRTVVHARAAE
jgi:nucleotide-binding universal stress UspA family protein